MLESGLEKIAYWLRLLGEDALLLEGAVNKRKVLSHADRVFITTSRKLEKHLKAWGVKYFVLPKDNWKLQLCLLLKHYNKIGRAHV